MRLTAVMALPTKGDRQPLNLSRMHGCPLFRRARFRAIFTRLHAAAHGWCRRRRRPRVRQRDQGHCTRRPRGRFACLQCRLLCFISDCKDRQSASELRQVRVNLEKATLAASSVASHPRYMCMHACRLLALLSQHSIISTASSQTVTRSDSNSLSSSTKPALEFTSGLAPYDHHMLRSSISYPTVAFSPHHQQVRLRYYNSIY